MVKISGAMRNVMWKGELSGTISIDTIADRQGLYGLGPVAYLKGELLIVDGINYMSTVLTDSSMKVTTVQNAKAPFFVYATVKKWRAFTLPDSVTSIKQLETYLGLITKNTPRPFAFRLAGVPDKATVHIVNLPDGSSVSSPDDAHKGQKKYTIKNTEAAIIGFFSTQHKGIFTHHDTYLHMHLISADKLTMGHLDEANFKGSNMKLFLPAE